jgi:preprotein translocase subunit SecE
LSRLNSVQLFRKVPEFFREVRQEVMRVTWPTRKELTLTTSMVFLMVFVVALFFFVVDEALSQAVRLVLDIGT